MAYVRSKTRLIVLIIAVLVVAAVWALKKPKQETQVPPLNSNSTSTLESLNSTGLPLRLPKGFSISTFVKDLPGARVIVSDGAVMCVSQTSEGKITCLNIKDGKEAFALKNLNKPHGLAINPSGAEDLYFAEENKISKLRLYSEGSITKIADLPKGDRHFTRTLGFGPEGRLYVSVGSTCDVCYETDPRYAAIHSLNRDGSDFKQVASGLRNSVFFTWHPFTHKLWATEMGRDNLGDNLPPDEINIVAGPSASSGQSSIPNFGWPICYGKNVHDLKFDKNQYIQNPCNGKQPSFIDLPAHSAPLGLAFVPANSSWPKEYWNNLIVAFHGSWNRSQPTGYKLVRIKLDSRGNLLGMDSTDSVQTEDFISGWMRTGPKTAFGRPVDVIFDNDIMYVSDDKAGVIYKITYKKS